MFFLRLGRLGAALRLLCIPSFVFLFSTGVTTRAAAADVTGQVVDATGRVLPRAYVRVLSENGTDGRRWLHRRNGTILADGGTPDAVPAGGFAHRIPDGDGAMRAG